MTGPNLDQQSAFRRAEGAYAEALGDATLVLDATGDKYVRLNGTGGWVFERLGADPVTAADLAPAFAAAYGLTEDRAEEDLRAFLADLVRRGLAVPA